MSNTAIIREVDVLILGGSSAAVAAALSLRQAGASVFLAAPRNYLGDDICGSLQLHIEAELLTGHPLAEGLLIENPSPRHLKLALESSLVSNDIDFVFGSYPVAALHNDKKDLCGAIIANRAGRQAIHAKIVIDASSRALFARLAGAPFTAYDAQTVSVRRRLLAKKGQEFGEAWKVIPGEIQFTEGEDVCHYNVYERAEHYELNSVQPQALAALEQHMYLHTWQPDSTMLAEDSLYALPDRLQAQRAATRAEFNTAAMTCLNGRCFVLSHYADVSDNLAQSLLKPGALCAAATTLAADISAQLAAIPLASATRSFCRDALAQKSGELRVRSNGLRPSDCHLPQLKESAHAVPVLGHYDVVVVGGGTGGAPAGIAAARHQASTLILEFQSHLGGVGTVGQISVYYFGNRVGFTAEIDAGVHGMGPNPRYKPDSGRWNPGWKQAWYHQAANEAGVNIWYQSTVYGVQKTGDRVTGILVAGPFGHGLVTCGAVVDSTGAAEIAANAGAPVRVIDDEHIAVQGTGLSPISPIKDYNNTDHNFIDDEDMVDVTAAMVSAKYKFTNDFDICQLVNSRERQQIIGEWEVSPLDILCDRQFPDTVCRAYSNFDSHGFTIHPLFMIKAPNKVCYYANVPFRALIPKNLDGVLATGLGVSAHRDSLPLIRMQPDVQNQGYAAGCAAAMSAHEKCAIREINLKKLQKHLIDIGCLDGQQLTASDNFPLAPDVLAYMVSEEWDTYRGISVMLGHPQQCKPLIIEAFNASSDEAQRLRYAHILCMQGDPRFASLLVDFIQKNDWDKGWNYRGMGQFGFSLSQVDTYITALSLCSGADVAALILKKTDTLVLPCDFSHARGIAIAASQFAQRGVELKGWSAALGKMLAHPEMHGFSQADLGAVLAALTPDRCENQVRNRSLREIVLARALFLLGDDQDIADQTLKAYGQDMRGHFARHAQALLHKKSQGALAAVS